MKTNRDTGAPAPSNNRGDDARLFDNFIGVLWRRGKHLFPLPLRERVPRERK